MLRKQTLWPWILFISIYGYGSGASVAQAWNLFSDHQGSKGPAYWTMSISGNQALDTWSFSSAELSWELGANTYTANVLTDLLLAQTFRSGNASTNVIHFVHEMPELVLEFEQVDLSLSVNLLVSSNVTVGPVVGKAAGVDILSRRERYWDRFSSGGGDTIATFRPGSMVSFDYFGAGVFGYPGLATNMGMVKVSLDGNVITPELDLYPPDMPVSANVGSPVGTQFRKMRLIETDANNGVHRVTLELLEQKNAQASTPAGLALTSFAYEVYPSANARLNVFEIGVDSPDVKLFSSPSVFDGNLALLQVGLGGNAFSGTLGQAIDIVVVPTHPVPTSSTNTLSGNATNTEEVTIGDNAIAGDVTIEETLNKSLGMFASIENHRHKNSFKLAADESFSDYRFMIKLDSHLYSQCYLWESLDHKAIDFKDADTLYELNLHGADELGQVGGRAQAFYVPLSKAQIWEAGVDQVDVFVLDYTLTLSRSDHEHQWEIGLIEGDPFIAAQGEMVLVVQKKGALGTLNFDITGTKGARAIGAASATELKMGGLRVEGGNHVVLGKSIAQAEESFFVQDDSLTAQVLAGLDLAPSATEEAPQALGSAGGGCLLK